MFKKSKYPCGCSIIEKNIVAQEGGMGRERQNGIYLSQLNYIYQLVPLAVVTTYCFVLVFLAEVGISCLGVNIY